MVNMVYLHTHFNSHDITNLFNVVHSLNVFYYNFQIGNIGQANYSATKAGVVGMTKTLAREFAGFNIRVNAVLPGFIETPMTEKVPERIMQTVVMMIPMNRTGKPEGMPKYYVF